MFYHGLFSSNGKINSKKIKQLKEKFPKIYAVHGNYELPIGSYVEHKLNFGKELEKDKQKLLIANIDCANELMEDNQHKFKPLIFHAGYGNNDVKMSLDNVIKNVEVALNHVEKNNYKLNILLENLPKDNENYLTTNSDELLFIKNRLASYLDVENFGFCFDFGHANSAGFIEEGNNTNFKRQHKLIEELGGWIKHAHLNYNDCHKARQMKNYSYKRISDLDWHGVFPLDDAKENEELKNIFYKLKNNTSVSVNGLVNLEIFPKYYFPNSKYMKVESFPNGYQDKGLVLKNIEFIRENLQ